ncbi:SdrD B-like domain-containing protein, partial [Geoalkalibacter halelectricus]|uniref:SdrD B-like domain-containing protein n=1 Tax=Geoalkalibacter halelectricus TaxID=2847045 RepID=UPI003D19C9B9
MGKRVWAFLLMAMMLSLGSAQAQQFWVGSVYSPTSQAFIPGIQSFDWASSGSGVAEGMGPAGSDLFVGDEFIFRYQAALVQFEGPEGQVVNFPGLNADFEITVVAQMPEVVVEVVPATNPRATFLTLPGGEFYIYLDNNRNVNVPNGYGFDDGILIVSGTINPGQETTFRYVPSLNQGVGSATLFGSVTYVNPLFVEPSINIVGLRFEGTINFPAGNSTTGTFFDGRGGEGNLDVYHLQENDLLLKVDASSQFLTRDSCIDVSKQVSVDGGQTWFDADSPAAAPGTDSDALYRFIVRNCGVTPLHDVTVNDPTLGIDELIGSLDPFEILILTHDISDFNFENLFQRGICIDPTPPEKQNTVTVTGNYLGDTVEDSDSAWIKCVCIDIEKQVSVDGGLTFYDADIAELAPETTDGAIFKLIVSNCGGFDLTNVIVTDPILDIEVNIGTLFAGSVRDIFFNDVEFDFSNLDQPALCDDGPGLRQNIADVAGKYNEGLPSEFTANDQDPAWVECVCGGSIGDFVWNDLNQNGIQDAGEPGIAGVTVNLYMGGELVQSQITDANGFYLFTGLCAGDYEVLVDETTLPMGFVASPCEQGMDPALDSNCQPALVTLPTNASQDLTIDFGYYLPCTGSIGDFVWNDLNQNGIQDAGEPGIAGVTVNLYMDGELVQSQITDANGFYLFTGLCAGDYEVLVDETTLP